jgi:tungstate transport system substrate-binding protein
MEGDPLLFNPYGVIAVSPARHPQVNAKAAARFIDWLTGAEGRRAITEFRVNGQQLFFPFPS